jgi:molecular chaperone DnaK
MIEMIASSGDSYLGGQDLDDLFVEYCVNLYKEQTQIDLKNDKIAISTIREKCKRAKEILSFENETKFDLIFSDLE